MKTDPQLIQFSQVGKVIHQAMKNVVERENYPYLKYYKNDFYEIDTATIANMTSQSKYLWIVHECGTHLSPLGVHEKGNESAKVSLEHSLGYEAGCDIYIVTGEGLRKVNQQQARAELTKATYKITEGMVMSPKGIFCCYIDVARQTRLGDANCYTKVDFTTKESLSKATMVDLLDIAIYEAVKEWNSLFARVTSVNLNGRDLRDVIDSYDENASAYASQSHEENLQTCAELFA